MTQIQEKKHLFVSGIQRSGTTALANTLSKHHQIAICVERFRELMRHSTIEKLTPELFEKERLLDFSDNYTHMTPAHSDRFAGFYQDLEARYGDLKYIGDKVPNNYKFLPQMLKAFPDAKFLCIVRDIRETASSWQTRADNEGDGWPETKTAQAAVDPWNNSNRIVLKLAEQYPDSFHVVDYTRFFDGEPEDLQQLEKVTDFLAMEPDDALIHAYSRARSKYVTRLKHKNRELADQNLAFIEDQADFETYERMISLAA